MDTTLIVAQIAEWLGVISVSWLLTLSPRLRRTVVGFKYARRDGFAAVSIALGAIIFAFLFSTTGLGDTLTSMVRLQGAAAELNRPIALAVFTLLPVIGALILRAQPPRSAGWGRELFMPALQIGLALALLTIFLRNRVMDVLNGITPEEGTYLLGALVIAVAEETVFRGYIQLRLGWWLGVNQGWLLTALIYAAWKLPGLLGSDSLPMVLFGLGFALAQGLVVGWLMRNSRHVLAPALYRAVSIWMNMYI